MFGGVLGPVLLMVGLASTAASAASLLLNLESVLTALVAWVVFRENVDFRIFLGMVAIVAGGVLLSWTQAPPAGLPWGALAIAGACVCWAIDKNLTRVVSAGDPMQIAAIKGGVAGAINISVALVLGHQLPDALHLMAAGAIGLTGYGISLVAFVLASAPPWRGTHGSLFFHCSFCGCDIVLAAPARGAWNQLLDRRRPNGAGSVAACERTPRTCS